MDKKSGKPKEVLQTKEDMDPDSDVQFLGFYGPFKGYKEVAHLLGNDSDSSQDPLFPDEGEDSDTSEDTITDDLDEETEVEDNTEEEEDTEEKENIEKLKQTSEEKKE